MSLPLVLSAGQSMDVNVTFYSDRDGYAGGKHDVQKQRFKPTLQLQFEGTGVGTTL